MLWNILKVFQFITVSNNNCIHIIKGEIYFFFFFKLQGKTSHALRGAESSTSIGDNILTQCEKYVFEDDHDQYWLEPSSELRIQKLIYFT